MSNDSIAYIADMATQLAALCRDRLPLVARLLDVAADLAREALGRRR